MGTKHSVSILILIYFFCFKSPCFAQTDFDTSIVSGFDGDTTARIEKALLLIDQFDKTTIHFEEDTFFLNKTQLTVRKDKKTAFVKIHGENPFYNEYSFYFLNNHPQKLCCVIVTNYFYDKQISDKTKTLIDTTTDYRIFCDNKLIAVLDKNKNKMNASKSAMKTQERTPLELFDTILKQIKFK